MNNENEKALKKQLTDFITKGNAHATFELAIKNLSLQNAGEKIELLPYTIWQIIEHLRIAQWDILEFCRNPKHVSPKWPDEYWPKETVPASQEGYATTINKFYSDRNEMVEIINDSTDLYTPFEHGDGQNLLREALLVADHNSYHTGEIIVIRRLLGDWEN